MTFNSLNDKISQKCYVLTHKNFIVLFLRQIFSILEKKSQIYINSIQKRLLKDKIPSTNPYLSLMKYVLTCM